MERLHAVVPRGAWPLIVASAYFAAAMLSIDLTRSADGIATMWPPGGILLAALLIAPRRAIGRFVGASAVACFAVNLIEGSGIALGAGYTFANMIEAVIAALFLRRGTETPLSFVVPRDVGRFCAAVCVAALASAIIGFAASGFAHPGFLAAWFATDVLGMLIVTPMIVTGLAEIRADADAVSGSGSPLQAALLLGLVGVVACAVFAQSSYPLLFLPMMALLVATYRLGPFGAATGVLIIATIASFFTGIGEGPLGLIRVRDGDVTWFLQFYIVMLFATALPIAAILSARARLMEECAESERVHRLLADRSRDIVARLDLGGAPLYVSPACREVLGYEPEETLGTARIDYIHPDDRGAVERAWRSLLAGAVDLSCAYRERRKDGRYVWLEATYSLVSDPATGAPVEVVASIRDISQRRAAELAAADASAKVEENNRLLSMAERIAHVGHWRLDLEEGTLFWSPEVYRIHAVDPATALRLGDGLSYYHADDRDRVSAIVDRGTTAAESFEFTARIERRDGKVRSVISRGEPEFGADGRLIALFGVIQDVTRQVEVERQLEAARIEAENVARAAMLIADTDSLTGVASRRKTLRALAEELARARSTGTPLSIATFDLDHFKTINDRYGHAVGDEVLQRVARVAQASVRTGDLIGRIGGEEFLVIFPGSDAALAVKAAERLRSAIERSAGTGEMMLASPAATISIGVAQAGPEEPGDLTKLLHRADCALYAAKQAGRNTLQLAA